MRRLNLREKAKIRGKKRHVRNLERWVESYRGFFPTPEPWADGFMWYGRPSIHAGLVVGRRAERWFQRKCIAAMLDVVTHLRTNKPPGIDTYVFALVTPQNLFDATVDVYWGTNVLPRMSPSLPPPRSLQREWNLPARFAERSAGWDEETEGGTVRRKELWAVGDVESLPQ